MARRPGAATTLAAALALLSYSGGSLATHAAPAPGPERTEPDAAPPSVPEDTPAAPGKHPEGPPAPPRPTAPPPEEVPPDPPLPEPPALDRAPEPEASDAPASDAPKSPAEAETPGAETPRAETPRAETQRAETPHAEAPDTKAPAEPPHPGYRDVLDDPFWKQRARRSEESVRRTPDAHAYLHLGMGGGAFGPHGRSGGYEPAASWALAVGVEMAHDLIAMELRYLSAMTAGMGGQDLRAHAVATLLRMNLGTGVVRPFLTTGIGFSEVIGNVQKGSLSLSARGYTGCCVDASRLQAARALAIASPPRIEHVGTVVPVGGGVAIAAAQGLRLGFEAMRHFLLGDLVYDPRVGRQGFWTLEAVMQLSLE